MTIPNPADLTDEELAEAAREAEKRSIQAQISMLCSRYVRLGGDLDALTLCELEEPQPSIMDTVPDPNEDPDAVPKVDREDPEQQ